MQTICNKNIKVSLAYTTIKMRFKNICVTTTVEYTFPINLPSKAIISMEQSP